MRGRLIKNIFLFSLLFLIGMKEGIAYIKTDINFYSFNQNTNFIQDRTENCSIIYHLNTNEEILKNCDNKKTVILNPEEEIFCWSKCNIVPKRYISQIDVKKGNELLARHPVNIKKENINQIISIILDKKINQKNINGNKKAIKTEIERDYLKDKDIVINFNGTLKINVDKKYVFLLNITGGAKVIINGEEIFNDLGGPRKDSRKIFSLNLTQNEHPININYWTTNDSNPNLLWEINNSFENVQEENLIYMDGSINKKEKYQLLKNSVKSFSAPGSYSLDYSVYPSYWLNNLSVTSNRTPLLLVHGLGGKYPYWNRVPSQLNESFDVWEFYYSPANSSNFLNAGLLKKGIEDVLKSYTLTKLDVVSHSMGGLVIFGYINNLSKDSYNNLISYGNDVRKFISIAPPLHGSYLSNRIILNETDIATCPVIEWYADPDDRSAQAYLDLAAGSEFSFLLNKKIFNDKIQYLTISGNKGITCIPDETKENNNGEPDATNDGLVAVSSASLLGKEIPLIILNNYDHANEIGQKSTCLEKIGCAGKCYWPFCFDAQHEVDIIAAFLNDDNVSTIKSLLGENDTYIDPSNPSINPYTKGSVVLKILPTSNINSVSLRNIDNGEEYNLTKWQDLIHNTQTNNWFYFSNNLNLSYSNEKYGLTFPAGTYKLYVNSVYKNKNIEIKAAQTTMEEINLNEDDDNDGTINENDLCPEQTLANLPQNTETKEYFINPAGCHAFVSLETTKWQTYSSNTQNIANQTGAGYFNTRNITTITNSIEGFDYQPLVDDLNQDGYNDIIIFSGNYLKIFDHELNLIDEKFIGKLQGQPVLYNIDSDSFMEMIFISNISSTDYFFVYEYNDDFKQEFNFTIANKGSGSGIKCTSLDNTRVCIFMDNQQYVHIVNMSSKTGKSYNTSVYADTYEKIPAIGDLHNNGAKQAAFWFDANNNNQYGLMVFDLINKSFDSAFNNNGIVDDIVESYSARFELKGPPILTDLNKDGKLEIAVSAFYDDEINFEYRNDWFTELFVYNSSGDKLFSKCGEGDFGNCNDGGSQIRRWEGTNPFIIDSNNDSINDICFIKDKKYSGMFKNMTINCYNYSGYLLLDSELSPRTDTVKTVTIADMNNDSNKEIITEDKIYKQDGTSIYSHNFGSNFAIQVDIDKNGGLDLITTKNTQTKLILDNYGTIRISDLSINPLNPSVDEDFNCSFILTGYDIMTANITWYKNNIEYRSETAVCNGNKLCASSKILAAQTSKNQEWKCSITAIANRKKSLPKSKSAIIKDSTEYTNYNKIQSGRSNFFTKIKTNNTEGMGYRPMVADLDADEENELIIFSNNYLLVYNGDLILESKKQVGELVGQFDIENMDNDNYIEIIAVTKKSNKYNFTIWQYDGSGIKIENSFDVSSQEGYQDIKCLDFDNDLKKECIFRDYRGIIHSYQFDASSENDDELDINISDEGVVSSGTNALPVISDFDRDNDLDALFWFKDNFTIIDSNKNVVLSKDVGNLDYHPQSDPTTLFGLGFVNLDKAGDEEIAVAWRHDYIKWGSYKTDIHLAVFKSSGDQVFNRIFDFWNDNPCINDNHHCLGYGSDFFIFDYDKDSYEDIGIYLDDSYESQYGTYMKFFNKQGDEIASCSSNKEEESMLKDITLADINNDNLPELVLKKAIYGMDGSSLYNFSPALSTQAPIAADLDKNGALDLIWTKQSQTKIFYGNCLDDKDNDNVCDSQDAIEGNSSQIDSNINSLNIVVDDTANLNRKFTGKKRIEFKQGNNSIVSFNFNFSKRNLNLNGITIEKQNHTNFGSILIKGIYLDSNETKTVYVDNLNESIETVCIKDIELSSIVEISKYCNVENEFLVKCNSTDQDGYNCTIMNNRLRIAGLKNSGVQQQQGDNTPPTITIMSPLNATYTGYFHINISLDEEGDNCYCNFNNTANSTLTKINSTFFSERVNSTEGYYRLNVHCDDTAGNPGNNSVYFGYENTTEQTSQSTTAGSGGGGSSSTCSEVWKCSDWSECNDSLQTRTCSPTYNCKDSAMPLTSKPCITPLTPEITETKEPKPQTPPKTKPSKTEEKPKPQPLTTITGAAIKNIKKPNQVIGSLLSSFIVFGGFVFYRFSSRWN